MNISILKSSSRLNSEITSFTDQNPSYVYKVDSEPDATFKVADTTDTSLENFLKRPVLIQSFDWSTSAPNIYQRFNPWTDFFSEPRIANRIAHYAFLRAKLHIRVLINGNAFHFGRAIMSYIPLQNFDQFTVDRAVTSQDVIQASQRPHIYLDPTYSQGGELHLPFFYPKNMLEIATSEYDNMGELVIHTMNPLKHANGATDNVTINVFAWAEDVTLAGPTSATSPDLSAQAGSDEYGDGIISKPAGVVARVARKLKSIPPIAPYARATEIAAGSVSNIASILGYCRPNDISTITSFRPLFGGNMANTNVEDTAIKLSVDAKQELTIDPRTVGLSGQDELGIKNIAQRESYLTTFDWAVSDNKDAKLFAVGVNPAQWDTVGPVGPNQEMHFTAPCFAAVPFHWWRGSMKYRFQIVASNFHRGRIRVVYEPFGPDAGLNYTTNYNRIIDLAEEKDFTVEVGWNQDVSYREVSRPGIDFPAFGPTYVLPTEHVEFNGMLSLYVVNDLTVPNSTVDNDIQVNVFVSAGDDFEVAAPRHDGTRLLSFYSEDYLLNSQSASEVLDNEATSQPSAPMQDANETIGAMQIDDTDATNHVFFGEEIKSFRPILKRYAFHSFNTSQDEASGSFWWQLRSPAMPYNRGYTENPVQFSTVNICEMTLLNYVSSAFTGWRGGVRHKLFLSSDRANGQVSTSVAAVNRIQSYGSGSPYLNTYSTIDSSTYLGNQLSQQGVLNSFLCGGTANPLIKNPVQDIEIPFYSTWRFLPSKRDSTNRTDIDPPLPAYLLSMQSEGSRPLLTDFVASGEDFNCFFFTGCPIVYRQVSYTP